MVKIKSHRDNYICTLDIGLNKYNNNGLPNPVIPSLNITHIITLNKFEKEISQILTEIYLRFKHIYLARIL